MPQSSPLAEGGACLALQGPGGEEGAVGSPHPRKPSKCAQLLQRSLLEDHRPPRCTTKPAGLWASRGHHGTRACWGPPVMTLPWVLILDGPRKGAQSFRKPRTGCPGGEGLGPRGEQGLQRRRGSGRTCRTTPGSGPRAEAWPRSALASTEAPQRLHRSRSKGRILPLRADGSD